MGVKEARSTLGSTGDLSDGGGCVGGDSGQMQQQVSGPQVMGPPSAESTLSLNGHQVRQRFTSLTLSCFVYLFTTQHVLAGSFCTYQPLLSN